MSATLKDVYVSLGPTLPREEAYGILQAQYVPPVSAGDVYELVEYRQARAILIIDGYFHQRPAVWHKEILYALSRGVCVVGAASMGALRAAELSGFGMKGVGAIFEAFRTGRWNCDDEVSVVHASAEANYRAASEALANIRHGLVVAARLKVVSIPTARLFLNKAKALHYTERAWLELLNCAEREGVCTVGEAVRLKQFIAETRPNLKRRDAIVALESMPQAIACHSPVAPCSFEATTFWEALTASVSERRKQLECDTISPWALWKDVALTRQRDELLGSALLNVLLKRHGTASSPDVRSAKLRRAFEQLRRREKLERADSTERWLQERDLSSEEVNTLLESEVLREEVLSSMGSRGAGRTEMADLLRLELKRKGVYTTATDRVRRKAACPESLVKSTAAVAAALRWYQKEIRSISGSLDDHAAILGFSNRREFLEELVATHWAESEGQQTSDVAGGLRKNSQQS
jgi:hypothetical protein